MRTNSVRVNMTLDPGLASALNKLAKKHPSGSVSYVSKELIKEALELRDDYYLCRLAESRDGQESISHEEAWKDYL